MKAIFYAVLLTGISLSVVGCADDYPRNRSRANGNRSMPKALPTATVDVLASGKNAYETNCMICHHSAGTGGKLTFEGKSINVEDLTSQKVKSMTDEKIIGYMIKGNEEEGMPAFKDKLSEGEMRDLVKYIRKEFHGQ